MTEQSAASRRTFLTLAGAGVAAAGAAAVVADRAGGSPAAASAAVTSVAALPRGVDTAIMAVIEDAEAGLVTVMVAGREVQVTDHALVASLARAVHPAGA